VRPAGTAHPGVATHFLNLEDVPANRSAVWEALDEALTASENAYAALADMKYILENITRDPGERDEADRERVHLGYCETLRREHDAKIPSVL
jgi:hypothetical protein